MELLNKKENWWIWLLIFLIGSNVYSLFLGVSTDIYEKEGRWYNKTIYWIIGVLLFFLPFLIMLIVLSIEAQIKSSKKLGVAGANIYESPYIWIILIIIPIIGWIAFMLLYTYLIIASLIEIKKGKLEQISNN